MCDEKFIFMPIPVCVSWEGESPLATSIFTWLCHSQSAFAFLGSRLIKALGSLSCTEYVTSWQFFSLFAPVMLKWKVDKTGPQPPVDEKIKQQNFREESVDKMISMLCQILTQGTPQYSVMHSVWTSLLFMSACMTLWMHVLFIRRYMHSLKIQFHYTSV